MGTYGEVNEKLLVSIAFEPFAAIGTTEDVLQAAIRVLVQCGGTLGLDGLEERGL